MKDNLAPSRLGPHRGDQGTRHPMAALGLSSAFENMVLMIATH